MKQILKHVWISAIFLTLSLSICAQSELELSYLDNLRQTKTPDTRGAIFVFHTDEFWLNLHHFLYVLGRAENKERDTSREAVAGAPADQERGFEKLTAKQKTDLA